MTCTKPMVRCETWETYKKQDGGLAYKAEFRKYGDITMRDMKNLNKMIPARYRKVSLVPCGHCVGCRLDYARDKAVQLCIEKENPAYNEGECWFLTLTYDDEHLRTHTTVNEETGEKYEGVSIEETDMQKFWKRIRKKFKGKKIQYLNCMEYGKTTHRPHAHAIVFGLPLDQTQFKRIGNNELGDAIWTTPELENIWKLGQVSIGEVTYRSCSYVARYTLKKAKEQYDDWWYQSQGKKKEWVSMSQSLGRWYYDLYKEKIYETDTVPVKDNNGNPCKPPRSFDRFYKKECPEKWKEVQAKREKAAIVAMQQREQSSDLKGYAYLQTVAEKKQQFKDLRGGGNYGI